MRVRYPRHGPAVVLDAHERPSKGIHRLAGQLPRPQAGTVHDGVDLEFPRQRRLPGAESGPVDLPVDDCGSLLCRTSRSSHGI